MISDTFSLREAIETRCFERVRFNLGSHGRCSNADRGARRAPGAWKRDVEKIGTPEPGSGASPTQNISEKSGEGYIFLNFTQARLFRVVDRLRAYAREHAAASAEARAGIDREHARNLRRVLVLRNAILLGTLVIAFTVMTALLLLASDVLGFDPGKWVLVSFAAGLVCFMVALGLVVVDAFLSVAAAISGQREFSR